MLLRAVTKRAGAVQAGCSHHVNVNVVVLKASLEAQLGKNLSFSYYLLQHHQWDKCHNVLSRL